VDRVVADLGDSRLCYLRQPENRGVAAARNRGMGAARGDLIAFLDSDDEWLPGKLARQVELMRRRPDRVGVVFSGVVEVGADGERRVTVPNERGIVWRDMLHRNIVHLGMSSTV